jgi:GR25 family glycosyltransferase involved in LPS biosynthesis
MKAFIIHLSKIESSLTTAISTRKMLENAGVIAELWEGCYGNEVEKQFADSGRVLHPWSFKGPTELIMPDSKYSIKNNRPGIKGCFMSHFSLWKKCVELNEPIMIFEDDVVIERGFFDVAWQDVLVLVLGNPAKSNRYLNYLDSPNVENPQAVEYTNSSMPGTPGYAIKPHAAKKLIDTYKNTFLPSDNAINRHHVKIEIHNCIMGYALIKKDGKKSLTRSKFWDNR